MASLFSKVRTALVQLNKKEINVNQELHGAFTVSQFIQVKIYSGGSFRNFWKMQIVQIISALTTIDFMETVLSHKTFNKVFLVIFVVAEKLEIAKA